MILVILVTTRKGNRLGTIATLSSNAGNMRQMSTPLATLHPVLPRVTNKNTAVPDGVVFRRDGTKMVRRNSHKNLTTASIGFPSLLGSLCGECGIGAVLVADKVVHLGWARGPFSRLGRLRQSDGHCQLRVDPRLTRHLRRDLSTAIGTGALPLSDPLLETSQTQVVPTRCLKDIMSKNTD